MRVYSCSGFPYDEIDGGTAHFRTKVEALASARTETKGTAHIVTVSENIIKRVDHERVVALLNGTNWSDRVKDIATVKNGRVVKADD